MEGGESGGWRHPPPPKLNLLQIFFEVRKCEHPLIKPQASVTDITEKPSYPTCFMIVVDTHFIFTTITSGIINKCYSAEGTLSILISF